MDKDAAAKLVYLSSFGGELFNLYTLRRAGPRLYFSKRHEIVMKMIEAMLAAEAEALASGATDRGDVHG